VYSNYLSFLLESDITSVKNIVILFSQYRSYCVQQAFQFQPNRKIRGKYKIIQKRFMSVNVPRSVKYNDIGNNVLRTVLSDTEYCHNN